MGLINWFLDAVILIANIGLAVIPIYIALEAFAFQRRRLAVWDDQKPMLGAVVGMVHVVVVLAMALSFYWLTYWLGGMPTWMRWIVG